MRLLRRAWHEHWALTSEAVASVGQLLSLLDVPGPAAPQLSFDEEEGAVELLWLVNGESLNAFVQRDGSVEIWGMDESGSEIFSFVGLPNEGSSDHSRALSFLASLSARVRVPL